MVMHHFNQLPHAECCNRRKACNTPKRDVILVQREPHFDPHKRSPSLEEPEEVGRPQQTAGLSNDFHLLLQHRLTAIASQDHEIAYRTFSSVQILVKAASYAKSASDFAETGRAR